nr:zinc finger, CCHC-type [Tanacetum cinerariifolium]
MLKIHLLRVDGYSCLGEWASKKQTCITGSTMEYEFVALAAAGKEAEWLRNLIHEIPIWPKPISLISIHCDNAATLAKAYSQLYNSKSRHIALIVESLSKSSVSSYHTMGFPQDILSFNILPRLPGNSVVRFKFVSKEWYLFLSSPMFKKMHFLGISNHQHQNPHKLLMLFDTTPCTFRTIDCEAPEDGLTPTRIVPFGPNGKNMRILTTFQGLRRHHRNSRLLHCIEGNCCDIYMHSLTSNSWRKITSANKVIRCENYSQSWMVSELLNENLYFLKPTYGTDMHMILGRIPKTLCSSMGANMDANIPRRGDTSFDIYAGKYLETFVSPNLYSV